MLKKKKIIITSVNFLKILAFELPGIPQEVWVSSSKPANLVNWYCRNQQRVWLAHKTTGEINCWDSLAMRSVLGHGSSHGHRTEFPWLWAENYTIPDLNLHYLASTTSWSSRTSCLELLAHWITSSMLCLVPLPKGAEEQELPFALPGSFRDATSVQAHFKPLGTVQEKQLRQKAQHYPVSYTGVEKVFSCT